MVEELCEESEVPMPGEPAQPEGEACDGPTNPEVGVLARPASPPPEAGAAVDHAHLTSAQLKTLNMSNVKKKRLCDYQNLFTDYISGVKLILSKINLALRV